MVRIRSESSNDYKQISDVIYSAFKQKYEVRLVETLRSSSDFIVELSLVAILNNLIVGHILFSKVTIKSEIHDTPALALAPLAIRQEFQNQGIGSALVKKGIEECKRLNHKIIIVLGHPNFYPRFGFKLAYNFGIIAPFDVPNESFLILGLTSDALDGISGTVEYPPAFYEG
ncbi:MAG: GNAT family N-acetyltransferase [Promethearchaeota archaeon]